MDADRPARRIELVKAGLRADDERHSHTLSLRKPGHRRQMQRGPGRSLPGPRALNPMNLRRAAPAGPAATAPARRRLQGHPRRWPTTTPTTTREGPGRRAAAGVDEGGVRLAMLVSMGAMLVVALAVPGAFGGDAVLFAVAYLFVRLIHLVLSAVVGRDDPDRLGALLRFAPTAIFGASLLVLAGFLDGNARIAVWVVALAIDYLGPAVIGVGRGWRIAPEHFAEWHGLIILIALGESIIAIGVGA